MDVRRAGPIRRPARPTITFEEGEPTASDQPHPRLRIAGPALDPRARPSTTLVEFGEKTYRVEFWPDDRWSLMPEAARPDAERAHTDDGWFKLSSCPSPHP